MCEGWSVHRSLGRKSTTIDEFEFSVCFVLLIRRRAFELKSKLSWSTTMENSVPCRTLQQKKDAEMVSDSGLVVSLGSSFVSVSHECRIGQFSGAAPDQRELDTSSVPQPRPGLEAPATANLCQPRFTTEQTACNSARAAFAAEAATATATAAQQFGSECSVPQSNSDGSCSHATTNQCPSSNDSPANWYVYGTPNGWNIALSQQERSAPSLFFE